MMMAAVAVLILPNVVTDNSHLSCVVMIVSMTWILEDFFGDDAIFINIYFYCKVFLLLFIALINI